ncbi:protein TOPAZ1 isoform X2 [Perca fluviatilis]|uniref:protein TOPAZ1 isoform X2 n=1 Tax=Perca fluviatilis TaxID=8168 RepID=UPI001963F3B0|nr:protein TOPAZ1 isoform X2 [Perca fluviatilis]
MLPSSNRVKLNRVAFKDLVRQPVPRRRRLPKSFNNVTTDSKKQEENQLVSEPMSIKDTTSVPSSNEPVQTSKTEQLGPENVTDTTGNIADGEPEENCVGTQKARRRNHYQPCKGNGSVVVNEQQGPYTRDIDRNMHPSPTGLAGSEGSLRRAVRASSCGDRKYIYSQQKTLCEQRQKSSSPGPEQSMVDFKIKKGNPFTETSKKIIIWIDQYPKVTLCDVAQKCDAFSRDCGYVLPDVLKTKVVRCFKQDMRACPRIQSEKSVCLSQSLTEHQRHLKKRTDVQISSSHTTCHSLDSWTSEGSATSSASFLLGGDTQKGECRTGMLDRDVEEDPGPGSCLMGSEIHRDKRIKLGDSVKDGSLPSTPNLESIRCKDPAKTDSRDKEKTCHWMSADSQSCLEHEVGGSSSFGSAVEENGVHKKPCCELDNPTKTDAAQMSSELFCQSNEEDTHNLESFTCQRVRAYLRKTKFSCARTYMSWPFSNSGQTLTVHTGTTGCPDYPSARHDSNSPLDQNQPCSSNNRTNDLLPDAPTDASSGTAHQVSQQNGEKREEDGESILAGRNEKTDGNMSSSSSEFATHVMGAKESLVGLPSDTATLSNPSQHGGESDTDTVSASSPPVNGPESDRSMSTPSPSALGLVDWETATTLSPVSSPFTHGLSSLSATPSPLPPSSSLLKKVRGVELAEAHSASASPTCTVKAVEKALFYSEETQMTSWTPPNNSDAFESCDSSLLLPQDEQESDEGILTGRSPPILEPYYNTSPFNHALLKERSLHNIRTEKCVETGSNEFMLPPLLSPVTSPQRRPRKSLLPQSPGCSDEEKEIINNRKHKILPGCHTLHTVNSNNENSDNINDLEHGSEEMEEVSTNNNVDDGNDEKETQDGPGCEYDVEQGNKKSEQIPSDPKIKETLTSGALTKPSSSPSSDDDDGGAFGDERQACSTREEGSSPSETASSESDETNAEAAGDTQCGILDEFTAYEQDILLVDVIQDDPELFENVPQERLLKLGPTRATESPKTRPIGVVKTRSPKIGEAFLELKQSLTPVHCDSPDITDESDSRPWRPQCSSTSSETQSNSWPATEQQTKNLGQPDANNNHVIGVLERGRLIQPVNSLRNPIPPLITTRDAPWIPNSANITAFKRPKSNVYCRQYFSESLSCGFKMCRFQHVPVDGDEKLCIETVIRFTKNPTCLQKAGAVFTGYYQNNPPGVYFSIPVLLSLLWALLKAGMVSDVFSVLSVSLDHKIVPGHEFLLALFNIVREKGLIGVVPELMQLTFKMAGAGLVLSLDCLDCVKNTPEFQQTVNPNSLTSGNHKLPTSARFPEYLNLAHSIVEIELCTKQEDWRRMGVVFRSICQSSKHPNQVGRISGRIAIALLSESKDKLSLPFVAFAETVCQNEGEDSRITSFLGRIGVSLMLRYHKTHQWAKGRRVVEVLSISKVNYSTLKGLFGNEDGATRCYLVTVATELFLLSGSLEGALNTLRENKWFLSSCSWPCEPADLESRSRVLMRLAEKTSHRDTLEVLCNLPGLKEPNDSVDISRYGPLFNSHLQVCVDRQILPVASDTVDFMLSKNLAVDNALLQMLLQKLGKQNLWLRAREVFRHSLSVGYYPGVSAPPGFMALIVPCRLGEVELALAFEMFITVNATGIFHLSETTTSSLSITLKRTQSCESEYLSAGSRILSAACIPQPKLIVHYTAVNSSQDQVFTLDVSSARCWLRHNHLWANEVWTH